MTLKRGDKFVVLPGMKIESTCPQLRKVATRKFTVTVAHCIPSKDDGWVQVNWTGSSGYWRWVTIKEEVA